MVDNLHVIHTGVVAHPTWTPEAVAEATEILNTFVRLLAVPTADGQAKRRAGKPNWKVDPDHEAALMRHLHRYGRGERVDPDSGANPLVHVAWRALALAARQEAGWPETSAATGSMNGSRAH